MRHVISMRSLCAILMFALLSSGQASAQAPGGAPPAAVTVVTLHTQDVTLTSTLPGRVVAFAVSEVRPQVNGIIKERLFNEGAKVAEGDVLYVIDDTIYQADLAVAQAEVAQANAALSSANKDFNRYAALREKNAVSEQSLDDAVSVRDKAAAVLQGAQAQLQLAQINLERTRVRAPISGDIGFSKASPGTLVSSGQADALAVIRALDKVNVDVTQSAADMIRWRRGTAIAKLDQVDPTVTLTLADGSIYEHSGLLTAAEPHVNESTGVVTLRMTFPNPIGLLLPGMYVQVEMPQGVAKGALVVPQQGVSRDTHGQPTALVVNAQDVVEARQLVTEGTRGADWIVTSGLVDGDRVIIAGLQKTGPGATVKPEERAAPGTAAPAAN